MSLKLSIIIDTIEIVVLQRLVVGESLTLWFISHDLNANHHEELK